MYKRLIAFILTVVLSFSGIFLTAQPAIALPQPGPIVPANLTFKPAQLIGLKVHPENPFLFDFILDKGHEQLDTPALKEQGQQLVKYFLAGLTLPEKEMWVNLSPYEKNRIIPESLGRTGMGQVFLAQDYLLKQVTASLMHPENSLGKEFWNKVYSKVHEKFGSNAQVALNAFNKVWIVGDKAGVYVKGNTVFVTDCHLKVMLEQDYLAMNKNLRAGDAEAVSLSARRSDLTEDRRGAAAAGPAQVVSQIVRSIILPELEREVNEGKNFAALRQVFHSLILAGWYKNNLKATLLNQLYSDQQIIKGIDDVDVKAKQQVYEEYLRAYRKGVFNLIKEDKSVDGQVIPRKYFSGGVEPGAMLNPKVNQVMTGVGQKAAFMLRVLLTAAIILPSGRTDPQIHKGPYQGAVPRPAALADTAMASGDEDAAGREKRRIRQRRALVMADPQILAIAHIKEAVKNGVQNTSSFLLGVPYKDLMGRDLDGIDESVEGVVKEVINQLQLNRLGNFASTGIVMEIKRARYKAIISTGLSARQPSRKDFINNIIPNIIRILDDMETKRVESLVASSDKAMLVNGLDVDAVRPFFVKLVDPKETNPLIIPVLRAMFTTDIVNMKTSMPVSVYLEMLYSQTKMAWSPSRMWYRKTALEIYKINQEDVLTVLERNGFIDDNGHFKPAAKALLHESFYQRGSLALRDPLGKASYYQESVLLQGTKSKGVANPAMITRRQLLGIFIKSVIGAGAVGIGLRFNQLLKQNSDPEYYRMLINEELDRLLGRRRFAIAPWQDPLSQAERDQFKNKEARNLYEHLAGAVPAFTADALNMPLLRKYLMGILADPTETQRKTNIRNALQQVTGNADGQIDAYSDDIIAELFNRLLDIRISSRQYWPISVIRKENEAGLALVFPGVIKQNMEQREKHFMDTLDIDPQMSTEQRELVRRVLWYQFTQASFVREVFDKVFTGRIQLKFRMQKDDRMSGWPVIYNVVSRTRRQEVMGIEFIFNPAYASVAYLDSFFAEILFMMAGLQRQLIAYSQSAGPFRVPVMLNEKVLFQGEFPIFVQSLRRLSQRVPGKHYSSLRTNNSKVLDVEQLKKDFRLPGLIIYSKGSREELSQIEPGQEIVLSFFHDDVDKIKSLFKLLRGDQAMNVATTPGGIDLNQDNWQWQVSGDQAQMVIDPQELEQLRRQGLKSLTPHIVNITPIDNLMNI